MLFQFTPLREGRLQRGTARHLSMYFNSRPSARGDVGGFIIFVPPSYFNSRPSARGDFTESTINCATENFNSRPSARGDLQKLRNAGS